MRAPRERGTRAGARWPLVAGIVVALVAGVFLTVTHRPPQLVVAPPVAVRAALNDPQITELLAGSHWNHVTVSALPLVGLSPLADPIPAAQPARTPGPAAGSLEPAAAIAA
jgi:hypothetical protein